MQGPSPRASGFMGKLQTLRELICCAGGIMESIGASERVMEYLDRKHAPQLSKGRILPDFQGKVGPTSESGPACTFKSCNTSGTVMPSPCRMYICHGQNQPILTGP